MANIQDDVRKFILEINESKNNGQTLSNLTKLEKETGKLRAENEELQKVMGFLASQGKKNTDEYKRMEAQLKQNKKTVAQNNVEMKGLRKTLDLNYLSMGDLKKRAMELRSTLGSMSKAANPEEYNRLEKELKQVGGQMDNLRGKTAQTQGILGKLKGAAGTLLPAFSFVAILAGFRSLITKMTDAIDIADNFEERLDNLSALTGLEGDALNRLGRTAQETSVKITDGNVRIKQSADDIVDAYTKVGSQRPELLKNADALASVTEDAIILSEAAKSKLEPAVAGLTTTMNQFNLPADQSRRIINAMAAGSKAGAADIPYLTQAIEKSGTTMNLMNITLEENIGLIESIAPNYAKAELAGNSLDKVFLKLKEKQIGYADGTFSVNAALEELEQRYKNGETSASIFGVEHAKMGELLVQNRDEFNRYTKAVTGTNVAIEQAAKNTNNAKAIQAQARNEYHNAAIELGQNLSPAMTKLYKLGGLVANAFSKMIATSPSESIRREQFEVNNLVKSIVSVNDNQKIRNGLIQELQQKYPSFLGNINAENVTNETLLSTLDDVNKAYLERIKIAVNEEDIAENEKQMRDVWKEQRELVKDIDRQYQSLVKNKKENATLDEKIAAIAETSSAVQGYGSVTYASNAGIANLQKERLLDLTEKENALTKEYNDLLRERETITPDETVPPPPGGGTGGTGTSTNLTDEEIKTRIEKLQAGYASETALLRKNHLEGKTSEDQYNADLLQAELKFLQDKLSIYKVGSKEYEEAISQSLEKQVKVDQTIKALLLEAEKELSSAKIENLQDGLEKQEAAELQKWVDEKAALQKRLIDKNNLSAQELALNETINQLIEQKEAEHQERLLKIKQAGGLGDLQNSVDAATPIDPNFASAEQQQLLFDARAALIEAQYEREQELAGNNQSALLAAEQRYNQKMYQLKSDQVDAEFALTSSRIDTAQNYIAMLAGVVDEESALGKALFLFNQALAIGEVWVNLAKANMKAVAASPLTLGQPWVGANTVMAGVQTGIITAQTVAKFVGGKGKKEGGFAERGANDSEPAGIYHKNEWIANAPTVRENKPFFELLNAAQRNGTMRDLVAGIMSGVGRRSGGYAEPAPASASANLPQPYTPSSDPAITRLLSDNLKATKQMTAAAEKLWKDGTYTRLLGRDGLIKQEAEYQKMKSNVTL